MDISAVVQTWETDEPNYRKLGKGVEKFLRLSLYDLELFPEVSFRVKDLLSIIRKIKKKNLAKKYEYADLKDKLGVRVVCNFQNEMDTIDTFIQNNFKVHKADKKRDALDHNKLDYISNHYDVSIAESNPKLKRFHSLSDLVFEIQVRTLNQHAWSNTSHALSYKQEANISDTLKRKVFRLLSLYEIADDEFSIVNDALRNADDNIIYTLLRKTEGKIYKFAKTDFDRDVSLYALNILCSYLTKEELLDVSKNIDSFIAVNEKKIRKIFSENIKRLHELPFLAQPEIFIIWYALEHFSFSITDHWENDFDADELEAIQTLWGRTIS